MGAMTQGDALAWAVYQQWKINGFDLPRALRTVATNHIDAGIREAAEYDFVYDALQEFCTTEWARERQHSEAG